MGDVLSIRSLSKKYQKKLVLNKVSMDINKGDIYGFVGENGSGKTTVIRAICGLINIDEGDISLFNVNSKSKEIHKAKEKLGAIVENPSIYQNMTAKENLITQATILGITDLSCVDEILHTVGLDKMDIENKKAGNFSLGMRQRLGIAMALINDPSFIILDEPMNGLDPEGIVEIRELILKLNQTKQITFLISSHILTELALIATKYGIISKGKIIKEITNEQLKQECSKYTIIDSVDNEVLFKLLISKYSIESIKPSNDGIKIYEDVDLNELFEMFNSNNLKITSIKTIQTGIEEYYLSMISGKGDIL